MSRPTLIIDLPEGRRDIEVAVHGVTIGRDRSATIRVDHPTVSRRHARLARHDDGWHLERLNTPSTASSRITDGTTIRLGRVRAWFFANGTPEGWTPPDPMPGDGQLVRCRCGKVGFAPAFVVGLAVRCRACGELIDVADADTPVSPSTTLCAGCRSPILPGESTHVCDECGAAQHAECHAELGGCATYGCSRVRASIDSTSQPLDHAPAVNAAARHDGWNAAIATLVGIAAFGIPAFAWAVWAGRRSHRAAVLGTLGGVIGLMASWFGWTHVASGEAPRW